MQNDISKAARLSANVGNLGLRDQNKQNGEAG
jgi:hypothetical protein